MAQAALNSVSAAITSAAVTAFTATGTFPTSSTPVALDYISGSPATDTIPAGKALVALVSNLVGQVSITDATTTATTIVSGTGGLTYSQTAASVVGDVIVTGGGSSDINLAAGANTVSVDVTPTGTNASGVAIGSATVNALAGGALVFVNANVLNATTQDSATVALGGRDTAVLSGNSVVLLDDTTNVVSVLGGGTGLIENATSTQGASNILLGVGDETVGVYTGSVATVTGAASGTIFLAGSNTLTGRAIINPNGQNVLVFPNAGASTLYGAGDAPGVTATGSDVVFGGIGYYHAGTGGGSFLESAASLSGAATTLIGGGSGDVLFAQSANVSLKGAAGTALLDAAGATIGGGTARFGNVTTTANPIDNFTAVGAAGGTTLNAGASNAVIFGAISGANTVVSGSGSSTVFGHSGATSGTGNTYLDGAAGGSISIVDFGSSDLFKLTGGQTVSNVSSGAGGSSIVTISDGTKVTFANAFITSSNVSTYFHS
jgi:fibronectin-binding autotransporter adhesin